jgi:iron complex outermembrane recepter protein
VKLNSKVAIAVSAALGASAYAGAAYAQSAPTAAAPESGLEEIIVTATRRSESIQDVPITIQAITGDQLEQLNVSTLDDVLKYLSNVTVSTNGPGQGNIYMRGLSAGFAGNQSSAAIAPFPNVATYLDDQSMTFPARNADVYMVDMERVEVLEGPQGTLFGGGAEAGAVRYITNKPKLNATEGNVEGSYGVTAHGDPNTSVSAVINLPLIDDVLAVRAVIYNDHRGGYIDNVASTFTRNNNDLGPASYGFAGYPAGTPGANNFALAANAQNPVDYQGMRVSALVQFNKDWSLLVQQSYQNMDAEGMDEQYPVGSNGQALGPLQETSFSPAYDKDKYISTAWTVNGMLGDIKAVYTGAFLSRKIENAMDYTNYSRTVGGFYYTCAGGPAGTGLIGAGTAPLACYSPVSSWLDTVETTHKSNELRFSTPDDWRLRGLIGGFWESLDIKDDMNFLYKSIPSCTPANLAAYLAGGAVCAGNVIPAPGYYAIDPTQRNDNVAFGEDLSRGYTQTAFFTSVDFDIIPKVLTVTGGTRYYKYSEFLIGSQYSTSPGCAGVPNGECVGSKLTAATHAADYSGFRSRANLTWKIQPDIMAYYTFSQGFRPGAGNRKDSAEVKIDINPATGLPTVGVDNAPDLVKQYNKPYKYPPDTLTNNEIGFKAEFLSHRLEVNGSAYIMDWDNVQTLIYNPPVYGNTTFGVQGPDYQIKGIEIQFIGKVTDQLTLQGSISHDNARETNSPCIQSSNGGGNPTPIGSCITEVWAAALHMNIPITNPLGAVGATPAFSPTLQYNWRARYDWSLSEYKMFATVGGNYVGQMYNEPSSFNPGVVGAIPTTTWLRYTQPSYTTYDASLGVSKDKWHAEAYGTNLGNSNASTFTTGGQFIVAEVPLRPRVLGVKFGLKF